jgi:hypothetical protein
VNSVPPWSDTRHLFDTWGNKNRGPEFHTFSPGTEYHFARNSFFPQVWRLWALIWKKGQAFDTTITEISKNGWNIEPHPPPTCHCHRVEAYNVCYVKLSMHFVEHFVRFLFDALTTDNPIGIWQKWKQSVPRYCVDRCIAEAGLSIWEQRRRSVFIVLIVMILKLFPFQTFVIPNQWTHCRESSPWWCYPL